MIRVIIYKAKRGGNLTVNNYSTVKLNYNLVPRALFPGFGGSQVRAPWERGCLNYSYTKYI